MSCQRPPSFLLPIPPALPASPPLPPPWAPEPVDADRGAWRPAAAPPWCRGNRCTGSGDPFRARCVRLCPSSQPSCSSSSAPPWPPPSHSAPPSAPLSPLWLALPPTLCPSHWGSSGASPMGGCRACRRAAVAAATSRAAAREAATAAGTDVGVPRLSCRRRAMVAAPWALVPSGSGQPTAMMSCATLRWRHACVPDVAAYRQGRG